MITRLREKGQITLPLKVREALALSKDSILSVIKVGDGLLLTPKVSAIESFGEKFSKAAKKKEIGLEELLKDLKRIRHK